MHQWITIALPSITSWDAFRRSTHFNSCPFLLPFCSRAENCKTELLPGMTNCMDMTKNISKRGEGRKNSRETFKGRCENIDLYLRLPLWVISSLLWPQSSRLIYDAVVWMCSCCPGKKMPRSNSLSVNTLSVLIHAQTHRHTHTYTHLDACRCMWLFFYNQLAAVALRSSDRKTELEGRYFLSKPSVTIAIPPVCCSLSVCSVVLWLPTAKKLSNHSDLIICTVKEKT